MTPEPRPLTIREAGAALREGTLSAITLTESVLARIEATEPAINAYITITAERARAAAARADAELQAGRDRGPLHGIPFALKDLYDTAGIRTTAGSSFLRERVPAENAFVVTKLNDAGIVLTGKLNLHEFAFGTSSLNPHYGDVRNPWDPERIAGGSSGGCGAAIAVGSCLGTLGTDTGGSIRIPASLCGIVGLMPTYGRVSRRGVLPLSWTLDHVGPLARTVEDAALILNATAGHDPEDPGSANLPTEDYTSELERGLAGVRVGVPRDPFWLQCRDDVAAACEGALETLQDLGATLVTVALPLEAAAGRLSIIWSEAAAYHHERLREAPERFGEDVRTALEGGRAIPAVNYINDQRLRRKIIEEASAVLREVDVLVSPTTPATASPLRVGDPQRLMARYTFRYDVTGIPALSLPCGFDANGLPIGLMIGARHFDEVTLCRVAHAYERATDWHTRQPAL